MGTVVFDIETVGVDFEGLDQTSQEVLLKNAADEEEARIIKEGMGLSPLTGFIVAIAMLDSDTGEGAVFFQSKDAALKDFREDNIDYVVCDEKQILENFWKMIRRYPRFVTYNGRGFDCPFIMVRSGILKVKPTRELMPYRYDSKAHVDLYDQMTFYGAMRRGFSLHMVTQAFGIKSPKEEGVSGAQVGEMFHKGECASIARYCMRDVKATAELFKQWETYIRVGA